jgi:BirA family biotin operon repressor/biotin-[acetyl-CoA-carboxylase] ligase
MEWDRWEILKLIISKIEKYYIKLKNGDKSELRKFYLERLYKLEQWSSYDDGEVFIGKIKGINKEGKLIIEKTEGSLNYYGHKEVKYLF